MAKLTIRDEHGVERVQELVDSATTVGRGSTNTIKVTDVKASRNHFRVEKDGEFFKVVDLGSTNGTKLNGVKVTQQRLKPGDVLSLGQTTFAYDGPGEKPVASAPSGTVPIASDGGLVDAPKYVLVVLEGAEPGKVYELGVSALTLGRHASNTISIDDESASNYHAEIKKEPIGYVLSDLGSTNGTRVKQKGAKDFEKVVKSPLSVGMQVRVGKTVLEYRNIGRATEDDQIFGTVPLDPAELGDKLAERPRRSRATVLAGLLGLMLAGGVAAVGVWYAATHLRTGGPEKPVVPPDYTNRIPNSDFTEGTDPRGRPKRWDPKPQPGVRIVIDPEAEYRTDLPAEQRRGLLIRRGGRATQVMRASIVETEDAIEVSPGKVYEVAGAMKNDGDGLYGLRVQWMQGARGERNLADDPVVLVNSQEWKNLSAQVRAPVWADHVKVGVFVEGYDGKTCFDNLSFREVPEAKIAEPPSLRGGRMGLQFEGLKGVFAATADGVPVLEQAVLELATRNESAISSLISALDPILKQDGAKVQFSGQLYDFAVQNPTNYALTAAPGGAGLELHFAVDRPEATSSSPRLSLAVTGPAAQGDVEIIGGETPVRLVSSEKGEYPGVREVVFNTGKTPQLYLRCASPGPVTLTTSRQGARRLVTIGFQGELTLDLAPENVGERQQMVAELQKLEEALRKQEWGTVCRQADAVDQKFRSRFPEAKEQADKARARMEAAFKPVRDSIQDQLKVLEGSKSVEAVDAASEKIKAGAMLQWAGTTNEKVIKDALDQLEVLRKTLTSSRREDDAQAKLKKAEDFFRAGGDSLQICILTCSEIVRDFADSKAATRARELQGQAEAAKKQYDALMELTDRLKREARPYELAGNFAEAIGLIENNIEYRKYARHAALKELNQYLEKLKRLKGGG